MHHEVREILQEVEEKNLSIDAGNRLLEDFKQMRYAFISFLHSRFVRLCLMVFVVHYLDVKFKVDRGSKRQQKEDKKKEKTRPKDSVLCSFSYSTLVQVTNGFLDQAVIEYVRKKHPLALPVCDLISSQFQDYFGFYLFFTCKNFEKKIPISNFLHVKNK